MFFSILVFLTTLLFASAFPFYQPKFVKRSSLSFSPFEEIMDHETTKDNLLSYIALHSSSSPMMSSYLNETKLQQKLMAIEDFQTRDDIIHNLSNLGGTWLNVYSNVMNNFNENVSLKDVSFGVFNQSISNLRVDTLTQEILLLTPTTQNDLSMDYHNVLTFMQNAEESQKLTIKAKATIDPFVIENALRLNVTFYETELETKVFLGVWTPAKWKQNKVETKPLIKPASAFVSIPHT